MKKYKWNGCIKYDEESGELYYHDNNKWNFQYDWNDIRSTYNERLDSSTLKKFLKKINFRYFKKKLCDAGIILDEYREHELLSWLKNPALSPTQVKRSMAVCLKHFYENSNDSSNNEYEYEIITTKVGQNLIINIKGISEGQTCWYFMHSEKDIIGEELPFYVISLPSIFFNNIKDLIINLDAVNEKDLQKNYYAKTKILKENFEFLKSHRLHQKLKVINEGNNKIIEFSSDVILTPYYKGIKCGCIPIPSNNKKDGNEPYIVRTSEIVATSPNVVDALNSLSQVWQDKFAKSVLISAPPGSGKEAFSKSIAYGTGRVSPDDNIDMHTISLADFAEKERKQELPIRIFGKVDENDETKIINLGLIKESKNKVIFLDEVHHPEDIPGIRASLLRTLESGTFERINANVPDKVENVLFILATSKPFKAKKKTIKGLNEIPPIDFWTRMTHVITIKHPFEGIWGDNFKEIICHYFYFFWLERLEKYFKIDIETSKNLDDTIDDDSRKVSQRRSHMNVLRKEDTLKEFSEFFYEKLIFILKEERIQPYQLSIRGFKNIITRLFSITTSFVMQGYDFDLNLLNNYIKLHIELVILEILEIATLEA